MTTVYDFSARAIDGADQALEQYRGQALLIVNTASRCGFTGQYEGLEALHRHYADQPFEVLGFPCNQFGQQEPGRAAEIASFCSTKYGVSFPMFDKVEVNGPTTAPLYERLKKEKRGFLGTSAIKWNFTKFLVDRSGKVVGRFAPTVEPKALEGAIERLL